MKRPDPAPRPIPILPVLTWKDLVDGEPPPPGVLNVGTPRLLNSGAAAIVGALRLAGVGTGSSVLLPAFNCPVMVDAIATVGAAPRFYCLHPNLVIDEGQIAAALTRDTRAVLVPHLFGRRQHLAAIRALCEHRGAVLVEDCAHMLFGSEDGCVVGSMGHFAVASPRKFLPLMEGGLLTSPNRDVASHDLARPPGRARGARLLFDGIDVATRYGRLRGLRPPIAALKGVAGWRRGVSDRVSVQEGEQSPAAAASGIDVVEATGTTRILLRRTLTRRSLHRRRAHFEYMMRALARIPGARLIDAVAPRTDSCVPYMATFLLDDPARQFRRLKEAGVPMWRWEYSARGYCEVADRYAEALVQLPCHQSLSRDDIDWILSQVDDTFRATRRRARALAHDASHER